MCIVPHHNICVVSVPKRYAMAQKHHIKGAINNGLFYLNSANIKI